MLRESSAGGGSVIDGWDGMEYNAGENVKMHRRGVRSWERRRWIVQDGL